jgi:pimeloyl-ACP methyl ester carboxylesterase
MNWLNQLALMAVRTKFKILSAFSKSKAAEAAFDLFCRPPSRHRVDLTPLFDQAERLNFTWRTYHIRGFKWNACGSRKALIIHGFQSSSLNFEAYVQPLIDQGMEVQAFDAPAHGGSSGKRINVLIYRDFILQLQQGYGPFQAVLAHSLGGLALSLALEQWPTSQLPRVALIAPATETRTAVEQYFEMIRLRDKAVHDAFNNIIIQLSGQDIGWFSIVRSIQQYHTPVLWVHDEEDAITPIADALPAWTIGLSYLQILRTRGLGHRRIYREPSVVQSVVRHLGMQ